MEAKESHFRAFWRAHSVLMYKAWKDAFQMDRFHLGCSLPTEWWDGKDVQSLHDYIHFSE